MALRRKFTASIACNEAECINIQGKSEYEVISTNPLAAWKPLLWSVGQASISGSKALLRLTSRQTSVTRSTLMTMKFCAVMSSATALSASALSQSSGTLLA